MKRANLGKVEFYKLMIGISTDLIEERTGSKLEALDPTIEDRLERALRYSNPKTLKEIHLQLDALLENVKKKGIYSSLTLH